MRLAIIARADLTGLGVQSRNWVRLLNPDKVIVINSRPFNNNEQHFEWYSNRRNAYRIDGFIKNSEINAILDNIDVLLTFEIPYNYELIRVARARGVKTIIQNNWEFTDYLRDPTLPLPDLLVNHSYWHLEEQKNLWPNQTDYCPTPVFTEDFAQIAAQNFERKTKRRFLHVAGRRTYEDRNGTQDLLAAMKLIPASYDFELVIKAQNADVGPTTDPRIIVDRSSPVDEKELYHDFDAVIMPRRYGGACLPMTEALASGLPVIMTDINPNNNVLPKEWLVQAKPAGSFMTRVNIDLYSADHNFLADKIVEFENMDESELKTEKIKASTIASSEYSAEAVSNKWTLLLERLGV